jgi:ferrous iron transport protein A
MKHNMVANQTRRGEDKMVPLADLSAGSVGLVRSLGGGHNLISRLAVLGFTPGAAVTVMRNHGFGPMIVSVRGAQIALGRGEARRILVHPTDNRKIVSDVD